MHSVYPDQPPRSVASDLGQVCRCPFYETLGLIGIKEHLWYANEFVVISCIDIMWHLSPYNDTPVQNDPTSRATA